MSRPMKTGLDYFPHDCDASDDEKIEGLSVLHGNQGYAVYFRILERIYRTPDGELSLADERTRRILIKKTQVNRKRFGEIIRACCSLGLFDRESYRMRKILTSAGIKRRMAVVSTQRERWRRSKGEFSTESIPQGKPHRENPEETLVSINKESNKESTRKNGEQQHLTVAERKYINEHDGKES